MKIVVTGAGGLLGWHAAARLHAANCAARFRGEAAPYDLACLDHPAFADKDRLGAALEGADLVLHFAGVNRAPDEVLEDANVQIAEALIDGCRAAGVTPRIVYANTIHASKDTVYGRSKRRAGQALSAFASGYTDLVLPHIFGECARPRYNNVTATLVEALWAGEEVEVNPDGEVALLHAGAAAQAAIDAGLGGGSGQVRPEPRAMRVPDLYDLLRSFRKGLEANIYPDLSDPFVCALYNSFRAASYPDHWPRPLKLNSDARGTLFEAVKGGGGGQTFASWTEPGVTRGDHFHLDKVERFLVLQGEAIIRIRRVLHDEVWEYRVTGETPSAVDMPTLHTHSIENVGEGPLLTLFWTHEMFDPSRPDTYADPVLGG